MRDTRINGNCINTYCLNKFNKDFRNLLKTNGYCKICTEDNKKRLHKENIVQIMQKVQKTNLEKYGVNNFFASDRFKEKSKETWINKYGVDNPIKSIEIQEKRKKVCLKKYGVDSPSKLNSVTEKRKETCLEKYGVEYSSQNPEIMEKISKNAYKIKEYIMPSGNIIKCQGYESLALDEILQKELIEEEDIVMGCKNVPTIWYNDEDSKKHRHYVDIFIPSQNRCIEVKSTWTAEKKKDNIFLKQQAGKDLGYKYEIWVYNNKGERVETYY